MTTLGVIHRMEDIQVVCFAIVFGIMALQSRRDRTFFYLLVSYLLGSAVSVLDVTVPSTGLTAAAFLNLALISLRYGAMAYALAIFLKAQPWFPRAVLFFCAGPLAAIAFSLHGAPPSNLLVMVYGSLAAQFFVLGLMLLSRGEAITRTPCRVLSVQFFLSAGIRCCQVLAVIHPSPGIVWLRDQLWFFNSALVGCMVPFTIIWMMNARDHANLLQQSLLDPLTGLLNRRGLNEAAERELNRYSRSRQDFAVAVADIDHFKQLNDKRGHAYGDEVLERFSDICKTALRSCDVSGRSGGEEFILLLPFTNLDAAFLVLERIRTRFESSEESSSAEPITVSIGVTATFSRGAVSWEQLQWEADKAMYAAKSSGRNRTTTYDSELNPASSFV